MSETTISRNNLSVFEDMTYEIKKYSFALKLLLDFDIKTGCEEYSNEVVGLLFDYSAYIESFSKDLTALLDCIIDSVEMKREHEIN